MVPRLGQSLAEESVCIIGFALETAIHTQEILKAHWSDLNLPGRTLNIPKVHVKSKTIRQIPLSKRAVEILRQMSMQNPASPNDCPIRESVKYPG